MNATVVRKTHKEYYILLEEVQEWIVKAETILSSAQPNLDEELWSYGQRLEVNAVKDAIRSNGSREICQAFNRVFFNRYFSKKSK